MTISDERHLRVKEERKRIGITQIQAAESCGVTRGQWIRYENGENAFDGAVLRAFTALGADAAYILGGVRSDAATLARNQAMAIATIKVNSPELDEKADAVLAGSAQNSLATRDLKVVLADIATRLSPQELEQVIHLADCVRKAGVLDAINRMKGE